MQKYLEKLMKQFKEATGIDACENSVEFNKWLELRKEMGTMYNFFISNMGVYPKDDECSFEIGKGKYDTAVLDNHISMITPYSEGLEDHGNWIITGNLKVYDKSPYLLRQYNNWYSVEEMESRCFDRLMTHNPYDEDSIKNWDKMHNNGNNVTIGFFGNIHDMDRNLKVKKMETLRNNMCDDYTFDYCTYDDNYYCAIASNRNIKKLIRK